MHRIPERTFGLLLLGAVLGIFAAIAIAGDITTEPPTRPYPGWHVDVPEK